MNVLIIYTWFNQQELMRKFSSKLSECGLMVDVICYYNFAFEQKTSVIWPKWIKFFIRSLKISGFFPHSQRNRLLRWMRKGLDMFLFEWILPKYDIIDFHAYYPFYHNIMKICINKHIKYDITLWGSDIMRVSQENRNKIRFGLDYCFRIKSVDNLKEKLIEYYGHDYDEKCRIVYFGSNEVDSIDKISNSEAELIKKRLYGETGNKLIVVCGYNGGINQNHIQIINALDLLNDIEKSKIHLVIPMTYLGTDDYINKIRRQLKESSLSFTILDHFLTEKEVATIRITAEIVINVQSTDALADSLKGHLYCRNICIFGEWLKYDVYTRNNIYYIGTSMDNITMHLKDVLTNYTKYKELCSENHNKIKDLFSWKATIQKQVEVYGE